MFEDVAVQEVKSLTSQGGHVCGTILIGTGHAG